MRNRILMSLGVILAIIAFLGIANPANAQNAHQHHRGACANWTSSISKGVNDLKANGVAGKIAKSLGIRSVDGSVTKQLKEQLTIGEIAVAVRTKNTGCDGHGGMFGAGNRTLRKGEKVAVKIPAKYGKDACKKKSKSCKRIKIKTSTVLPVSCWNKNTKSTIWVYIWVKKSYKPAKKSKKKTPKKESNSNSGDQTNKQATSGQGNCNSNNTGNNTGPGTGQGSCNQWNVICQGSGSCSPSTQQTTNNYENCVNKGAGWSYNAETYVCSNKQQECVAQGPGWTYENDVCNYTPPSCSNCPPPPCQDCNPQPNPPSCTDLGLVKNGTKTGLGSGLGVTATVSYTSGDDTFQSATFTATGPNQYTSNQTTSGNSVNFLFPRSGTYQVTVRLNFASAKNVTSQACKETITVNLTCPPGNTPNSDGSACVKDGNTTPDPDPNTPGPNPDPDPNEPYPGGYACYSTTTGAPVQPVIINGVPMCPAGSYGNPT